MNPGIQNSSYDTIFETSFYALLGIEKKHGYMIMFNQATRRYREFFFLFFDKNEIKKNVPPYNAVICFFYAVFCCAINGG